MIISPTSTEEFNPVLTGKRKERSEETEIDNKVKSVAEKKVKVTFVNPRNTMKLGSQLCLRQQYEKNGPIDLFTQGKDGTSKMAIPPVPDFPAPPREESDPLLINAISSGNLKGFEDLLSSRLDLQRNINLTIENEECGRTCLHWAVAHNQYDIIRFLLEEKNAQIDVKKNINSGWKPAIVLALESSCTNEETLKILRYLASKGACIDIIFLTPEGGYGTTISSCEEEWRTAAGYYAIIGDLDRLKLIHELGADLNALDDMEMTPLRCTLETLIDEDSELVNDGKFLADTAIYLIKNGANLNECEALLRQLKADLDATLFESPERIEALEAVEKALVEALESSKDPSKTLLTSAI